MERRSRSVVDLMREIFALFGLQCRICMVVFFGV